MPRLLHTADWHLGRRLEGRSRHAEQVDVLREICEIAEREQVDAVLIAGDVYDSYNPPAEAESLYYSTIVRLVDGGRRPVIVIAGNHDSPERLRASDPYGRALGVITLGFPEEVAEEFDCGEGKMACCGIGPSALRLRLASGEEINLLPLPYPSESRLGRVLSSRLDDEDAGRDYEQAVRELMRRGAEECFVEGGTNIVMSHLFVAGGKECDSERPIQVGGAHSVQPGSFPEGTSYVALGHLHRPQQFDRPDGTPVRYSGSPLCYSFSEAGQQKGVTIVDVTDGVAEVRDVALTSGRPVVNRKGLRGIAELEDFLGELSAEAWATLEVTLEEAPGIGWVDQMHRDYPNILAPYFGYLHNPEAESHAPPVSSLPVEEQFERFVESKGEKLADEVRDLFRRVVGDHDLPTPGRTAGGSNPVPDDPDITAD